MFPKNKLFVRRVKQTQQKTRPGEKCAAEMIGPIEGLAPTYRVLDGKFELSIKSSTRTYVNS